MSRERSDLSTFLDLTLPRIHANLALDDALLRLAEENDGPSGLRIWEQQATSVVLGASGRIATEVNRGACDRDGVPIARRTSGGGTVTIGRGALNFAVVLPIDSAPELKAVDTAQSHVMTRVASSIASRGLDVQVRGSGDLAVGDFKVCGSAQRRLRRWLMVHATILYDYDLSLVDRYLGTPSRQPEYRRGRRHARFVRNLTVDRPALVDSLLAAWGCHAPPPEVDWDLVREIQEKTLSVPSWIERL